MVSIGLRGRFFTFLRWCARGHIALLRIICIESSADNLCSSVHFWFLVYKSNTPIFPSHPHGGQILIHYSYKIHRPFFHRLSDMPYYLVDKLRRRVSSVFFFFPTMAVDETGGMVVAKAQLREGMMMVGILRRQSR